MDVVIVQVEVRDLRPWGFETRGSRPGVQDQGFKNPWLRCGALSGHEGSTAARNSNYAGKGYLKRIKYRRQIILNQPTPDYEKRYSGLARVRGNNKRSGHTYPGLTQTKTAGILIQRYGPLPAIEDYSVPEYPRLLRRRLVHWGSWRLHPGVGSCLRWGRQDILHYPVNQLLTGREQDYKKY